MPGSDKQSDVRRDTSGSDLPSMSTRPTADSLDQAALANSPPHEIDRASSIDYF